MTIVMSIRLVHSTKSAKIKGVIIGYDSVGR